MIILCVSRSSNVTRATSEVASEEEREDKRKRREEKRRKNPKNRRPSEEETRNKKKERHRDIGSEQGRLHSKKRKFKESRLWSQGS